MSMSIDDFLFGLKQSFERNEPLLPLLSINLKTAPHISSLQHNLQQFNNKQISQKVENANLVSPSWASLESLVESYLRFVRDVDPWSLLNSIDLIVDVLHTLSISLNTKTPQYLSLLLPVLYEYMTISVPLAKLVDEKSMAIKNWVNDYPRTSYISNDLLKCLNNIRSDPEINQISNKPKIKMLFHVSITLCNVYFSIGKHVLCNNVFSNINVLNLDINLIEKSQLMKYRYILGKYHSQQASYTKAFYHLDWCYNNLPTSMGFVNHIKILKYLLPVGLLIGKVPSIKYLQNLMNSSVSDPDGVFGRYFLNLMIPLITAYKKGDLQRVSLIISQNEELWKKLGLWVGFVQRIRLLVIRNVLTRTFKIQNNSLRMQDVQVAISLSFGGNDVSANQLQEIYHVTNDVDITTAENVLASLSFNGLMRGKATGLSNVVMSKDSAFPSVAQLYLRNHPMDNKESWLK